MKKNCRSGIRWPSSRFESAFRDQHSRSANLDFHKNRLFMEMEFLGNRRNTVREYCFGEENSLSLTEFWGKLGEFCEKLGEFNLAHT